MIPCPACELAAEMPDGTCPNNHCPRHWIVNPDVDRIFTLAHPFSLLSWAQAHTLYTCAQRVPTIGDFGEFGVYRGGSALMLHLASPERTLHLFDTFAGHPPLWSAEHDHPGSHQAGTLGNTSTAAVWELLTAQGATVQLWPGIFPASLEQETRTLPPFALVHVDVDLWASATAALRIFGEQILVGGMLVMDDFNSEECPGVLEAVEEYLYTDEYPKGRWMVERTQYPTYQAVLTKVRT